MIARRYQDYLDAWNRHDAAAIGAHHDPAGRYATPFLPQPLPGQAMAQYSAGMLAAMPDVHCDMLDVAAIDSHRLAARWTLRGTWSGPFNGGALTGMTPTGKSMEVTGMSLVEFGDDGRITSETLYYDRMSFLTQLGVLAPR